MNRALLSIAIHSYGTAAVLYLGYLIRQLKGLASAGRALVGTGLCFHATSLTLVLSSQAWVPIGIGQGFSILAWAVLAIYLAVDLRYRVPVVGSFLMPVALTALVPSVMINSSGTLQSVPAPLLPVHISVALLGIA